MPTLREKLDELQAVRSNFETTTIQEREDVAILFYTILHDTVVGQAYDKALRDENEVERKLRAAELELHNKQREVESLKVQLESAKVTVEALGNLEAPSA